MIAFYLGMAAMMSSMLILMISPLSELNVPIFPNLWGKNLVCEPLEKGRATFYGIGDGFDGRKTANGEIYEIDKYTAAHGSLPINSIVKVRRGDQHVFVRINDRGPAKWTGNTIDLTPVAFKKLAPLKKGVVPVTIELCERT